MRPLFYCLKNILGNTLGNIFTQTVHNWADSLSTSSLNSGSFCLRVVGFAMAVTQNYLQSL